MQLPFSKRRFASAASTTVLLATVVVGGWCLTPDVQSQAPAAIPTAALIPLITKLKAQQAQMAANQTKIEAQTALLKENIRQAKIYSARSGSGHR